MTKPKSILLVTLIGSAVISVVALKTITTALQQQHIANLTKSISDFKIRGIKAQYDCRYDEAESLFRKALKESGEANDPMKSVEFLCRIIKVQILNNKLAETNVPTHRLIDLASTIQNSQISNSNLEVWLDDTANDFYKRGEQTSNSKVKEFCLRHYLDLELSFKSSYDPILVCRSNQLIGYLSYNGIDDSDYNQKVFSYLQRTKPTDKSSACGFLLAYLTSKHQFDEAEALVRKRYAIRQNFQDDTGNKVELYRDLARLKDIEGDLKTAKYYRQKTLQLEKQCGWLAGTAVAYNNLAFTEERLGNSAEAINNYKDSLVCLSEATKQQPKITPKTLLESGKVFAAEHLQRLEKKTGLALTPVDPTVKRIREENPHWNNVKNLDTCYLSTDLFPQPPAEIIPTHFRLQNNNL